MKQVIAVVAVVSTFAVQAAVGNQVGSSRDLPPASIALVTTFADGRAQYDLVSARAARLWTSNVPRIVSATPPEGTLSVTALQIARQLVGRDVHVTVSVLRGSKHEQEDVVAIVRVSPGAHVLVDELRAFGLQPIDLSLADAAPMEPFFPSVLSVTPELEISAVDLLTAPYPGYRITVRNLSSKPIANFQVQSYRGTNRAISTVQRGSEGRPAMEPGGSFSFDLNLTSGTLSGPGLWSPTPLDVIEINSVLWDDGTIVGDMAFAAARRAIPHDAGRRFELRRAVDVLRAAESETGAPDEILARLRTAFQALPIVDDTRLIAAQGSMRNTRAMVLDDLRWFEQYRLAVGDTINVRRWIQYTIKRYESWIDRLAP
jgi:hypothetical protein